MRADAREPGPSPERNPAVVMIAAAILVWQGWALTGWYARFHTSPAVLLDAGRQYYAGGTWSAAALVANWLDFGGAVAALAGLAVVADAAGRAVLRLAAVRWPVPGLALTLGLGFAGSAVLGAGLAGLLIAPPRVPLLGALGLLGAAGLFRRRRAVAVTGAALRDAARDAGLTAPVRWLLGLALVTAAAGVLNIEMAWDALTYHLRLPSFYLGRAKIYDVWHHYCATFPSLVEMLFALGQLVHGDVLARLLNALQGGLLVVATLDLARACGVRGGLAAAILVASPVWLLLLDRAYIDPGFSLFLVYALRLLVARIAEGARAAVAVSALCAGFGLSCKYVGVVFLPAALAAAWPLLRTRAGRRDAVRWNLVAFAPLAAWLARNTLHRGNPVAPMLGGLFGTGDVLPGDVTPFFQREHPLAELLATAPERCLALFANAGRIDGPVASVVGGLFPLLLIRPPATPAAQAVRRAALGYTAGWWLLAPDSRFFLPALPWVAILLEEGWTALRAGWNPRAALAGRALVEGSLAAGALYGAAILWTFFAPFALVLGFDTPAARHRQSLPPAPFTFYMKEHVNAMTPPGARIWYLSNFSTYYVQRECVADFHFGRSRFTEFALARPTAEGMAKGFRQRGFDYLLSTGHEAAQYLDIPGYFDLPDRTWAEFRRLLATRAEVAWQSDTYVLFRLTRTPRPARPLPAFPLLEAIAFRRADLDLSEGRTADALKIFLEPPPLLEGVGTVFVRQGDAWMVLGEAVKAEAAFRRALAAGTDNPRVRAGIAQARLRQGDPNGALPHAEEAFKQHPYSAFNAASLAQIYAALGRRDDAKRLIKAAVALFPNERQYREMARALGAE